MSRRLLAGLALALSMSSGAGCATPRVDFARGLAYVDVPPKEWKRVLSQWSRHSHITHDWDTALDTETVLMVPEMRSAWITRIANARKMAPTDRAALIAQNRRESEQRIDVWVFLQTSRWDWNDLASRRSVWTVTLTDGERVVGSIERQGVDHEKLSAFDLLFPWVTPFTRVYRVSFPTHFTDGTPVLRPDAPAVIVRFAGPLGSDAATWLAPGTTIAKK